MRKTTRGFTIVELLIVVVVIAILAAITIVTYSGIVSRTRDAQRAGDIQSIAKLLEMYYIVNGQYPAPNFGSNDPCSNLQYGAQSNCSTWKTLAQMLAPFSGSTVLPVDPINVNGGGSGSPKTHEYIYMPYQNNSDWPLSCAANTGGKVFQSYYLLYFTEQGPVNNRISGTCSNSNPFFGSATGVYQDNYLVVHS